MRICDSPEVRITARFQFTETLAEVFGNCRKLD